MSFAEFAPPRGATIPEHNRLRGLDNGNPHPQYAQTAHAHPTDLDMRAVANSLAGGTPPANGFWSQCGTSVVDTDAAGVATVTFPQEFTGLVTVVVSNGDSSPTGGIVNSQEHTTTQFKVTVLKHDGTPHDGLFRVNWMAVGW